MQKTFEIAFNSSETFREIFQGSAEGILMVDEWGNIQLANPVSERMFGYENGELTGKKLEVLLPSRYHAKHVSLREQFRKNPSPRRMGIGRDLMAIQKDGHEFPVEVSLSYKEINNLFVVVAFIIDITERKKVEEALKHSEEQLLVYAAELEKKVQTRTDALNKLVEDLEKANQFLQEQIAERKKAEDETKKALDKERELNELKTKFVSIASHEFRTPLSTVLSSASLVQQYKERGELEKIDKHIHRIKSSVNHLTAILNDFLSLGRLEEGRIEVIKELVSVDEFFKEIHEEIRPLLKEGQHIELTCELQQKELPLDKRVLRNILFNLLSNASKYSAAYKPIHIYCQSKNDNLIITIRDEGIGIPEVEVKHLFERFFRASNVTNIQGTGLGLNIVKRYVDLLNGTIDFTSAEGKGSTFSITLPLL
ncbi:MAG TPA: PAS domain-containing sensor histidine kinase [Cyclobacteriaceae bacterium]|nr:PAS domain-containing sensor histidine kinase [Cyclobacteriaceae bacterium]HRJ82813.1 PAS domain-containing sensor histidine kinase [Cyclobacteriaceae bacterium]